MLFIGYSCMCYIAKYNLLLECFLGFLEIFSKFVFPTENAVQPIHHGDQNIKKLAYTSTKQYLNTSSTYT